MNRASTDRNGTLLIVVLVCLGVATSIMLVAVRSSLQVRRQMRQEVQLEQTLWLQEAALNRAVMQLRSQPAYQGETWQVSPPLHSYPDAMVEIAVSSDELPSDQVRVAVTARLRGPSARSETTQRSQTLIISTQPTSHSDTQ